MGAETQQHVPQLGQFSQQQSSTSAQQASSSGLWGPQAPPNQPYGNIQASQTHYGPAPPQPTAGAPAPVAEGYSMGPINTAQPMHCPAQQVHPVFLGATVGHDPFLLHCGACNYQGWSVIRQTRGWAHAMWAVMTLGIGYFVPVAMDTNHFCPQCGKHVAIAKLM